VSEPARAAVPSGPALDAALRRLPRADAKRLRRDLASAADPRVYEEIADHVLASAALLDDPAFARAMDEVRRHPPDWSGPARSIDEWRALVHDTGTAR
jgi:hypothetical protein